MSWLDNLPSMPPDLPELFPQDKPKATSAPGRALRGSVDRQRFVNVASTTKAIKAIDPLPQPGEHVHMLLAPNAFSTFDIVPAILDIADQPADQVLVLTLGISQRHILALGELVDAGRVKRVQLVVSDYFRGADRLEFESIAAALNARPDFELAIARTHAKVLGVRLADGSTYVAYGSANARTCRNYENCTLANDGRLFDFYATFAADIFAGRIQ